MELVYLWIDKYKNIEKQGFNFSPRFECTYDEDKNELTIDDEKKKDYVSIFPKNINVTAIVGENGSGKSSVIFQEINQNFGFSPSLKIVYKNSELEIQEPYRVKNDGSPYLEVCQIINKTNIKMLKTTILKNIDLNSDKRQYLENHASTTVDKDYSLYFDWDILTYFDYENFLEQPMHGVIREKSNELIKFIQSDNQNDLIDYKLFYKKIMIEIILNLDTFLFMNYCFIPYEIRIYYNNDNNQEFIKSISRNALGRADSSFEITIDVLLTNIENDKEIFFQFLKEDATKIDIYDDKKRALFDLSHGERSRFVIFFLIYIQIEKKSKQHNLLVYLDEPDLMFHPNWQKKIIKDLIELFKKKEYNIHLIFTTHSPFLLSDLPKENVVFLEKGKQVDVDIETFGANIHTLLSHGFFMKDGLMGEYAKEKINEIIKFLEKVEEEKSKIDGDFSDLKEEYETKKKEFWYIQSIIGEDYLKQVIKNHLVEIEKILLGKDEAIEEHIKRLKQEIEQLEKRKND